MRQVNQKAREESVCQVKQRCAHAVRDHNKRVCLKHISEPQVRTDHTVDRVSNHHDNNVSRTKFDDQSPLTEHHFFSFAGRLLVLEAFEEVAQDVAHFNQTAVKAQFHGQLKKVGSQESVPDSVAHFLQLIFLRTDRDGLHCSLDDPKEQPAREVEPFDLLKALSLHFLLVMRVGDHDAPDHKKFKDDPDEDLEVYGLR